MKGVLVDEFNHFEFNFIRRDLEPMKLELKFDVAGALIVNAAEFEGAGDGIIGFRGFFLIVIRMQAIRYQTVSVVEEDSMSGNLKSMASSILCADSERESRAVFQSVNDSDRTGNCVGQLRRHYRSTKARFYSDEDDSGSFRRRRGLEPNRAIYPTYLASPGLNRSQLRQQQFDLD